MDTAAVVELATVDRSKIGCRMQIDVLALGPMSPQETSKTASRELTAEHKAALAEGRAQGRAVRNYLEALDAHRPRRGRKRTPDSIRKRLGKLEDEMATADPLRRLQLVQERMDLDTELTALDNKVDVADFEDGFIKAAAGYSKRKNITYAAWREVGVPAIVLQSAGIKRGS
jgi:hypothetical protein